MKLDLTEFYSKESFKDTRTVSVDLDTVSSGYETYPVTRHEPFDLTIEVTSDKRINLTGDTRVTVTIPCDRCLEGVSVDVEACLNISFPLKPDEVTDLTEEDEEALELVSNSEFDMDLAVSKELLINWPAKVLCRDDCKGICPKCGTNLNSGSCSCTVGELDPRMAAFLDVFNQSKEV